MKTMQGFAVSTMAAAVLLALAGCGGMSTRDSDSGAAPAVAQGPLPQCANSNYDQALGLFTVINPAPDAVNQQCLLTVHPMQASGRESPAPYYVEGRYDIVLSGGGGGAAGGERWNQGGGGGGAGAAPIRTVQYLSPGVYKLTIGTGGRGAMPNSATYSGNLTSITHADTGAHIAGHMGADTATQIVRPTERQGHGGEASAGGSFGGDGGDARSKKSESAAQAGGESQTPGYAGVAGQAGVERSGRPDERSGRNDDSRGPQANAGGGGGAGVGSGGVGESRDGMRVGGTGDLGGGGAGGRGGFFTAHPGGAGGHGFIQLARTGPPLQARAPIVVVEPAPVFISATPEPAAARIETAPAPEAMRPAKKDRN